MVWVIPRNWMPRKLELLCQKSAVIYFKKMIFFTLFTAACKTSVQKWGQIRSFKVDWKSSIWSHMIRSLFRTDHMTDLDYQHVMGDHLKHMIIIYYYKE